MDSLDISSFPDICYDEGMRITLFITNVKAHLHTRVGNIIDNKDGNQRGLGPIDFLNQLQGAGGYLTQRVVPETL